MGEVKSIQATNYRTGNRAGVKKIIGVLLF